MLKKKNNVAYKNQDQKQDSVQPKLCQAPLRPTKQNISKDIREFSAFFKHVEFEHNAMKKDEIFEDYFQKVNIVKAYTKVLNRSIEEGTFMINHNGEVLNLKTEWNQPRTFVQLLFKGEQRCLGVG